MYYVILIFIEITLDVDFVMLFAGFKSRCSPHSKYYGDDVTCNISALLCIGEGDEVIPLGMYFVVYSFRNPLIGSIGPFVVVIYNEDASPSLSV